MIERRRSLRNDSAYVLEQKQAPAAENSVTTDIATHFSSTMSDQPKES